MRLHIITPFSRWQNFDALCAMLKAQGVASWTLLFKHEEKSQSVVSDWIRTKHLHVPQHRDMGLVLVNAYVQQTKFDSNDYYAFLMDDDFYPPDFVKELSLTHADAALVITGMARGHNAVSPHPTWSLLAGPEHLHYGHVGLEQAFFKGSTLEAIKPEVKDIQKINEEIVLNSARIGATLFLPNLQVWFNWFEEGRWNK